MNTLAIGCLSGLLACVGSFVWAMSGGFFRTVERIPPKVRLIQVVGAVALIANVIALVAPPPVGVGWGLTAILMYGAALALFWWAIRTNWRRPLTHAFTPDQPGHLTQDGPYRWIRHPFYSSYLIAWLAGAVATSKVWLLVPFAALLAIYWDAATEEENKFAKSPLRDDYRRYQRRTGRFLPKLAMRD